MKTGYMTLSASGFRALNSSGKKTILLFLASQVLIAGLDGGGLFLLSKLLKQNSEDFSSNLDNHTYIYLIISVVGLFLLRSLLATFSTYYSLQEFAVQEVEIGQTNFKNLLDSNFEKRLELSEADYFTKIDRAPNSLIQGYLVSVFSAGAEILSGLVIFTVVILMQPVTAITAMTFFVFVAFIQHKLLTTQQAKAGLVVLKSGNKTYELLTDAFQLQKLLHIYPSSSLDEVLRKNRLALAKARAKQSFIASLPRYFMESMLAVGFVVISGITWLVSGKNEIGPALVIFAAAGFRLLPIVNRVQGLLLSAIGNAPLATEALKSLDSMQGHNTKLDIESNVHVADNQALTLKEICYTYPGATNSALTKVSLEFEFGKKYAIVGPSGSGKTTLVDLILGLLKPTEGILSWNNLLSNRDVGYVPQDSTLSSADLISNVALEWDPKYVDKSSAELALKLAHLNPNELPLVPTDQRMKMSGGQRQRVGLARAIYRAPQFLILDEATSSLDSLTESLVMETVNQIGEQATLLIIAHRLSTVQDADVIIYLDAGEVLGVGTFLSLQESLPEFANQVRLGTLIS